MAIPKIAIGIGVAVVAALGLLWATSGDAKADALKKLAEKLTADKLAAHDAGVKEGTAHGIADKGQPHNPRPNAKYAETTLPKGVPAEYIADVQKSYATGYASGYAKNWVAPEPIKMMAKEPGTPDVVSACDQGYMRGFDQGAEDSSITTGAKKDPEPHLATDGSKAAQNASGDPESYRRCFREGYEAAYHTSVPDVIFDESKAVAGKITSGVEEGADALLKTLGVGGVLATRSNTSSLLAVGYEPRTGALIKVAGHTVMSLREPINVRMA
jgi:hypothetical protein